MHLLQGQEEDPPARSRTPFKAASPFGRWKDAFQAEIGLRTTVWEIPDREGERKQQNGNWF